MVRKNIFEILKSQYNINREFEKITILFEDKCIQHSQNVGFNRYRTVCYSLENMIDEIFPTWKGRGTCISCKNMRQELGINDVHKKTNFTEDYILTSLEYYKNIFILFINKVAPSLDQYAYSYSNSFCMLDSNMNKLLDHLNYEQHVLEKEDRVILVPKNPAATAVAEISSKDTAFAILKYHHASLKGQQEEKRQLLLSIANEYEPLFKKPIDGFKDYFDKATNMLNNMNIRHNNKSGNNKKDLVAQMSNDELEKWYDELYQLLLFCILIKDNKDRKDKIDVLLKQINMKPDKKGVPHD